MRRMNGPNCFWILAIGLILHCGITSAQRPQINIRSSSGRAFGVNPGRQAQNQGQQTPQYASAIATEFDCPEEFGYYPHPTDCSQYYVCVFGGALLESCTGGLMYSHELQTCDWPRNVGCDVASSDRQQHQQYQSSRVQTAAPAPAKTTATPQPIYSRFQQKPQQQQRQQPQRQQQQAQQQPRITFTSVASSVAPPAPFQPRNPPQQQYPLPPPELRVAPNPVITSRGQPKQEPNYELYEDEQLPPAEEEETDRQQRVYRGQPSTIGQVQRDRDGIYAIHNINSLPNHAKVGSFAFNNAAQDTYRVETSSNAPVQNSYPTRPKVVQPPPRNTYYNTTNANNPQYDPNQFDAYYSVYDDDADLYRDVDYGTQYNQNSQRPQPEIQSTNRPVVTTTTTTTTTTPAPHREIYVSQKPAYKPVTYGYEENNQNGQPGNQGTRQDHEEDLYNGFNSISEPPAYVTTPTPYRTASPKYTPSYATTPQTTVLYKQPQQGQQHPQQRPSQFNPEYYDIPTTTIRPYVPPVITTTTTTTTTTPPPPPPPPSRTNTRTRGGSNNQYQPADTSSTVTANRGTHPPRVRPTLKPSNTIVSKAQEFVDIYKFPASRPEPIYPTPTPDKTAAKCRKDVCLLPDCFCGGKDIPGDLPVEQVPQIVLLTFDDSVNDLNKQLYMDLFEKGRVNPNGCPISATFYVSHEWTDYSQVQNLYADGHEMASHTVSHSFGEQFTQKKWNKEVAGQREILAAYGGVKLEDVRGMRAPFLSIGGNKMFKMLYDSNFTYDSSMPVYENKPPSWPYTLDYRIFHDCMIPPCPTKSYPGVWEVPMVMWQDLNGGRCSMGDACANPPEAEGVTKMLMKNFERHYTTNRAPFGLYYHAAWFTQPHHKEGFITFLDQINAMKDVWIVTNHQALQWVRDPTPMNRLNSFQPFQCNYSDRPKRCNHPKVCNLWHKSGVRYMKTCQPCPEIYPWTGKTGIRSSRIDNDIGE